MGDRQVNLRFANMPIKLEPWLQTHHQLVEMELDELRSYTRTLEGALENERRRLEKDSEEQASKMTEEERMDFCDCASEDFYRLGETFPRILRYSLFVNTFSLLEHTLLGIAHHLRYSQKLDLSPNDLRDKGIILPKTYLKKVAQVSFPDDGTDWADIGALNEIRNIITHGAGYFPEDHPKKQKIDALITRWSSDITTVRVWKGVSEGMSNVYGPLTHERECERLEVIMRF
jgi:hypothetical protein